MKKRKPSTDVNVTAFEILQVVTRDPAEEPAKRKKSDKTEKNPSAVALGRLGGLKGGNARAKKLSPERRKEIARRAALVRYGKKQQ